MKKKSKVIMVPLIIYLAYILIEYALMVRSASVDNSELILHEKNINELNKVMISKVRDFMLSERKNGVLFEFENNHSIGDLMKSIEIKIKKSFENQDEAAAIKAILAAIKFSKILEDTEQSQTGTALIRGIKEQLAMNSISVDGAKSILAEIDRVSLFVKFDHDELTAKKIIYENYGSDGYVNPILLHQNFDLSLRRDLTLKNLIVNIFFPSKRRFSLTKDEALKNFELIYASIHNGNIIQYKVSRSILLNDYGINIISSYCTGFPGSNALYFDEMIVKKLFLIKDLEALLKSSINVGVTSPQSGPSTECHTGLASIHEQNPAGFSASPP